MASNVLARLSLIISAQTAEFNKALSQSSRNFDKFSKGISGTAKSLVAGFGLLEIGRGVINVTSEFEKFEAVLTNTLGSSSKAQRALKDIRDFALATPFEVSEITAAYVRWANQGLTPTIDKMQKLGDVASSLGAGFEQTAEAFKDLAVGQTKRLEEVGISAEAIRGTNMLKLAFKGVTLEIEKNAEGVNKALEVYSQLNGVLGTSDAVSKTLGGRISNLSDAWSNLLLTIGSGTGILGKVVDSLTKIVNALSNLPAELALVGQAISPFHDLSDVSKETLEYLIKFGRGDTGKQIAEVLKPMFDQDNITFLKNLEENHRKFINTLILQGESMADINTLWDFYVKKRVAAGEQQRADEKDARLAEILRLKGLKLQVGAVEELKTGLNFYRDALKKANDEYDRETDPSKLRVISQRIAFNEQQIKQLETIRNLRASDPGFISSEIDTKPLTDVTAVLEKFKKFMETFKVNTQGIKDVGDDIKEALDIGPAVSNAITSIAEGLGEAAAGAKDAGKKILSAVASFAQQLGALFIATGIGKIAFDSFQGPAMVAAGVALVAAASAAKVLINNRPNLSKVATSNSRSATASSSSFTGMSSGQDSSPQLMAVIHGEDLWIVQQNYERNNKKTKSGG